MRTRASGLKALEALRSSAADPETRQALADVLLKDDNPGVRTQAVDLLTLKPRAGTRRSAPGDHDSREQQLRAHEVPARAQRDECVRGDVLRMWRKGLVFAVTAILAFAQEAPIRREGAHWVQVVTGFIAVPTDCRLKVETEAL